MTLEEIFEKWEVDSKIDPMDLGQSSINIPKLHHKYLSIHSSERKELRELKQKLKKLNILKFEYFTGVLNGTEELKKLGWEPFQRTLLKQDVPRYIETDPDVIKLESRVEEQQDKVDVLASILKEIMTRNFVIKTALDWKRFEAGMG